MACTGSSTEPSPPWPGRKEDKLDENIQNIKIRTYLLPLLPILNIDMSVKE